MNTILFRGKRVANGEWAEGFYYEHEPPLQCFAPKEKEKPKSYILKTGFADWNMPRQVDFIEVLPETVGQFTRKESKDKQKLFDGDIFEAGDGKVPTLIFWNKINAAWYAKNLRRNEDSAMGRFFDRFIGNKIGNRWDNLELLEEKS